MYTGTAPRMLDQPWERGCARTKAVRGGKMTMMMIMVSKVTKSENFMDIKMFDTKLMAIFKFVPGLRILMAAR